MSKPPKQFFVRCCLGLLAGALTFLAKPAVAADLVQVRVKEVTASSDGTENAIKWPHNPGMAIDGNTKTCWASLASDTIGAWLKFDFGSKNTISQIQIVNGWIPEGYPNFFTENYRAKKITLIYDNGKKETFDLQDNNDIQTLSPVLAGDTESITLRVDGIYPASSDSEKPWVTISEVTFFSQN
jgi:hypothetical protein